MTKQADWIEKVLREAKKAQPLVTDEVSKRMKNLLEKDICDRPFARKEISETATTLINDMSMTNAPNDGANHED